MLHFPSLPAQPFFLTVSKQRHYSKSAAPPPVKVSSCFLCFRRQVEHFVDLTNGGILQPGYPPLAVVICPLALSIYICDTKETFSIGG